MTIGGHASGRHADLHAMRHSTGVQALQVVLVALAAVAVSIMGWRLFQTASRSIPAIVAEERQPDLLSPSVAAANAKIAGSAEYPRFFDALRTQMPADYRTILAGLSSRVETSDDVADPDRWISEALRALRVTSGVLAAKAEGSTLGQVFALQRTILATLGAEDKRLCVDFLYGGSSRAFDRFAAGHRALVTDFALANLAAIVSGRQAKIARAAPTDADFDALEIALRDKGLSPPEIAAILDGRQSDPPIDDPRLCDIGGLYLDTLAALPEPLRLRIYGLAAELMARS